MNFIMLDKMSTNIYTIIEQYGKYEAFNLKNCDDIADFIKTGISARINNFGIDEHFDGSFEAIIFQNGKLTDIELNSWSFNYSFKGDYHEGSYYNTSFEIECLDPNDDELILYSTPHKIKFSEENVLCNYLEMIYIYSHFENADIALKFNYLSRSIDEGMHGGRGREPMRLTYGDILDMIKYFKNYYKNLGENKEKLLLKKIKDTVNGSIDYLKKRLELDKIE